MMATALSTLCDNLKFPALDSILEAERAEKAKAAEHYSKMAQAAQRGAEIAGMALAQCAPRPMSWEGISIWIREHGCDAIPEQLGGVLRAISAAVEANAERMTGHGRLIELLDDACNEAESLEFAAGDGDPEMSHTEARSDLARDDQGAHA